MFPRCIRRIYPWKIAQIISLVDAYRVEWRGNQEQQDLFAKALEDAGLKRKGTQYDPTSGGPRTYLAQLKALGLIYEDGRKKFNFTIAGEDVLNGKPPKPILQKLLLRFQYPSVYSRGSQIAINPDIKVKPFLFLLKLIMDEELGYLTNDELIIPILYGHNIKCLSYCKGKILELRSGKDISEVINDKLDFYTVKSKNRSLEKGLKDAKDIANTFKNCLQAVGLIDVDASSKVQKYYPSEDAHRLLSEESSNKFIKLNKGCEEQFQRQFGAWDRSKDTRRMSNEEHSFSAEKQLIKIKFYEFISQNIVGDSIPPEFIESMHKDWGFTKDVVSETVRPHLMNSLNYFESTYIELAQSGKPKDALRFEQATAELLEKKLKFKVTLTGQKKRKGVGGYSDLFFIAEDGLHCAIVDTKASNKYSLSSDDFYKMSSNYAPNYKELFPKAKLSLEFCSYIAGGFKGNIDNKLQELDKSIGVKVSAITARDLLYVCANHNQSEARQILTQSKLIRYGDLLG
jgi:hypothetical protein